MKIQSPRRAPGLANWFAMGPGAWLALLAASALLCGIVAYWALQLGAPKPLVAPHGDGLAKRERPDVRTAGTLFGQAAVESAAQVPVLGNVQVLGVLAAGRQGSAILIIDGQPARAYSVGETIGPGQRITRVDHDFVVIADNGKTAQVPAPERGSIAVLTAGDAQPRNPSDPALAAPLPSAQSGAMPRPAGVMMPPRMAMPDPASPGIAPPDAGAPNDAAPPAQSPGQPPQGQDRPGNPPG